MFEHKKQLLRLSKLITRLKGFVCKTNHRRIELNITFDCNLKCINCNRSCRQAPATDHMRVEQIEKFITESEQQKREYEQICVVGGEPTLHPQILEIIKLLLLYRKRCGNKFILSIATNGYGQMTKEILSKMPAGVLIQDTKKTAVLQEYHVPFNIAPKDVKEYRHVDYANKCVITCNCGPGLSKFGYYICSCAAGIDRVLGFDVGRKRLPLPKDMMLDQARLLCGYCGHFIRDPQITEKEKMTISWGKAYSDYKTKRPVLTDY